ncbi:hypothetical protein [Lentzea sp. NEAU-D7]|uniref:hypothetical protein n=1 Tax=Lentzea sp. NEAU-D7 TaxID=2994667 RepID=UPI00224B112D|nr:hypothetical protein [Lentzea sp. NEAU-D7]MCX2954540.1 hypothetical protein [Lentzea sp. NEAU-D7]
MAPVSELANLLSLAWKLSVQIDGSVTIVDFDSFAATCGARLALRAVEDKILADANSAAQVVQCDWAGGATLRMLASPCG